MAILMETVKHRPKHFWQKIMTVIANISFACCVIGVIITLIYGDDVTKDIKAAMGAITFICFAIGIVLKTMGSTSIPNLKPNKD
jgi:hypothetical protein